MASLAEPAVPVLETAAAERLYERHSSRVFGYCLKTLGSREDAEDAVQTTFMQAFRALRRGIVPTFEAAWLLTIARNVCLARHRAGWRRRQVELARDPQDLAELAAAPEASEPLDGLGEALARLPVMQVRVILLREWQGYSYEEIAADLGLSRSAVESLLFRARRNLARELGARRSTWRSIADLGWIATAVKSALGGAATAKVAAGAAAITTVGLAVGSSVDAPAPGQLRSAPSVVRPAAEAPRAKVVTPRASTRARRAVEVPRRDGTAAKARRAGRTHVVPRPAMRRLRDRPASNDSAPVAPTVPTVSGPGSPSGDAPAAPSAPSAPVAGTSLVSPPAPAPLPLLEPPVAVDDVAEPPPAGTAQLPPAPALPEIETPAVPAVPELPPLP